MSGSADNTVRLIAIPDGLGDNSMYHMYDLWDRTDGRLFAQRRGVTLSWPSYLYSAFYLRSYYNSSCVVPSRYSF